MVSEYRYSIRAHHLVVCYNSVSTLQSCAQSTKRASRESSFQSTLAADYSHLCSHILLTRHLLQWLLCCKSAFRKPKVRPLNGQHTNSTQFLPWSVDDFLTSYIGIPIFVALYVVWKVVKRTRIHPIREIDLFSEKQFIDDAETDWLERQPRNVIERIWFWIA